MNLKQENIHKNQQTFFHTVSMPPNLNLVKHTYVKIIIKKKQFKADVNITTEMSGKCCDSNKPNYVTYK